MRPNVHIEVSGLPPRKLPDYYKNFDLERLARKMIFGTDWPGVPGPRANARAIANLGLARETLTRVLHENARRIYRLDQATEPAARVARDETYRP
jgi:predicted TIM-barrel fold metal-dependent hydrolase